MSPLNTLDFSQSYAIIEKDEKVLWAHGTIQHLQTLDELENLHENTDKPLIFLNPYSAIAEKGYQINEPPLPIRVLIPEMYTETSRENLLITLPNQTLAFKGDLQTSLDDEAFSELIARMQKNEIQGGNAVQVLLSRNFCGQIDDFDEIKLQSLFHHLLARRGQYMTFLLVDRSEKHPRYFVGASIEKHLEITQSTVSMIPISGTFRKVKNAGKAQLINFLRDQKEIDELTQVMEEEFKMMVAMCPEGGEIKGPLLRESGSVIHTEYHLEGQRTDQKVIPMLRHSLHAATLIGGPIESAARIIAQYETEPRRYYGGQVGILYKELLPQSSKKISCLDSAILIRSAEIDHQGHVTVRAGGTITKDSDPFSESQETRAKADSLLKIFGEHQYDDEIMITDQLLRDLNSILQERNRGLSTFHFKDHSISYPNALKGFTQEISTALKDITITIINNEDHFADVKAFMLRLMGAEVTVVDTLAFDPKTIPLSPHKSHIVIIGPGPGDVNDLQNPRIKKLHEIIQQLKSKHIKMLGVCLGHQALCLSEGFEVRRLDKTTQGVQETIPFKGRKEKVGLYNSFIPFDGETPLMTYRGPNFISVQFHPESVMTQHGFEILKSLILNLLHDAI